MMDQVEAEIVAVRVKWNRRAKSNAPRFAAVVNEIRASGWALGKMARDPDPQMFCHRIEIRRKST